MFSMIFQYVKQCVKSSAANVLYLSGVLRLLMRLRLKGRLVVLMYHRVLPSETISSSFSSTGIVVDEPTFRQHVKFLKRWFRCISAEELEMSGLAGKREGEYRCLITFDDGWYDNYEYAHPILKRHEVPALIFLPINFIGTSSLFWQEELSDYLYSICTGGGEHADFLSSLKLAELRCARGEDVKLGVHDFVARLKAKSNAEIDAVLETVRQYCTENNIPRTAEDIDRYMSWGDIRQMAGQGVNFGSHATSHRLLTNMTRDEVEDELSKSKRCIEAELGSPVSTIAYPNGNYDAKVIEVAKKCGYKFGFTTESGYAGAGVNPYKIKRINIHQNATKSVPMLLCRILGVF